MIYKQCYTLIVILAKTASSLVMKIHLSQHPFFLSFLQVIGRTPSLCTLEQRENLHQYLEQSSTVASSASQLGKTFQALCFCALEHTTDSSCFEFHLEVDKSILQHSSKV
jgi:hypothetical protein